MLPPAAPQSQHTPIEPGGDLTKLPKDEKLLASLYVLSRPDIDIPPPLSEAELLKIGGDDIARAIERIVQRKPHRLANLLGGIGGTSGSALGSFLGRGFSERGRWKAILAGAIIGTYPPAIAGAIVDKIIDPFTAR